MSRLKKATIIFNPGAGRGLKLPLPLRHMLGIKRTAGYCNSRSECVDRVMELLTQAGMEVSKIATQYPGHATEIASEAAENGQDIVIAVGGDGTINEVINGLAGTATALGVVPLGTANVFAIQMKLPWNIEKACEVIARSRTRKIDLGKVNGRCFACMAGIGYDAFILKKADRKLKKICGALAYPIVALTYSFRYKFGQISVKIDGQPIARRGHFVLICNGKYYGGGMVLAPKADPRDGYLDVCIFKYKNLARVLSYLLGLWRGRLDKYASVEYFQCKKLKVSKKGFHPVHVDAEYLCETPVKIKILPKSLKTIVP